MSLLVHDTDIVSNQIATINACWKFAEDRLCEGDIINSIAILRGLLRSSALLGFYTEELQTRIRLADLLLLYTENVLESSLVLQEGMGLLLNPLISVELRVTAYRLLAEGARVLDDFNLQMRHLGEAFTLTQKVESMQAVHCTIKLEIAAVNIRFIKEETLKSSRMGSSDATLQILSSIAHQLCDDVISYPNPEIIGPKLRSVVFIAHVLKLFLNVLLMEWAEAMKQQEKLMSLAEGSTTCVLYVEVLRLAVYLLQSQYSSSSVAEKLKQSEILLSKVETKELAQPQKEPVDVSWGISDSLLSVVYRTLLERLCCGMGLLQESQSFSTEAMTSIEEHGRALLSGQGNFYCRQLLPVPQQMTLLCQWKMLLLEDSVVRNILSLQWKSALEDSEGMRNLILRNVNLLSVYYWHYVLMCAQLVWLVTDVDVVATAAAAVAGGEGCNGDSRGRSGSGNSKCSSSTFLPTLVQEFILRCYQAIIESCPDPYLRAVTLAQKLLYLVSKCNNNSSTSLYDEIMTDDSNSNSDHQNCSGAISLQMIQTTWGSWRQALQCVGVKTAADDNGSSSNNPSSTPSSSVVAMQVDDTAAATNNNYKSDDSEASAARGGEEDVWSSLWESLLRTPQQPSSLLFSSQCEGLPSSPSPSPFPSWLSSMLGCASMARGITSTMRHFLGGSGVSVVTPGDSFCPTTTTATSTLTTASVSHTSSSSSSSSYPDPSMLSTAATAAVEPPTAADGVVVAVKKEEGAEEEGKFSQPLPAPLPVSTTTTTTSSDGGGSSSSSGYNNKLGQLLSLLSTSTSTTTSSLELSPSCLIGSGDGNSRSSRLDEEKAVQLQLLLQEYQAQAHCDVVRKVVAAKIQEITLELEQQQLGVSTSGSSGSGSSGMSVAVTMTNTMAINVPS